MITRRLIVNFVVFFAVSVGLVAYGVIDLLGDPFRAPTAVSAVFPDASSLFPNFSVQLNGVDVGTVTGVRLVPNGARVSMAINPGVQVPGNVVASIDIANDLGQQVVELTPRPGPRSAPLTSGAVVPVAARSVPVSIGDVVNRAVKLLDAVPPGKLNSLLATLATALRGQGQNLRTFISASTRFSQEFLASEAQFRGLLANAPPLLDAVNAVGPELQGSLANTEVLVRSLAQVREQLDPLFSSGSQALGLTDDLVSSQSANLACSLHDLAQLAAEVNRPDNLANLSAGLADSWWFFGGVASSIQPGTAKALSNAEPASSQQYAARVRLLVPPATPSAMAYPTPQVLPPIQPGAGCANEFGQGAGPAVQPGFHPAAGGQLAPAPADAAQVHGGG